MTDDLDRQKRNLFVYSLSLLDVDENGLTDDNDLDCLAAISYTLHPVRTITRSGATPEEMALYRLVVLTKDVLQTWAEPNPQAMRDWLVVRSELLKLKLTCN
jgi:hypothetical protein